MSHINEQVNEVEDEFEEEEEFYDPKGFFDEDGELHESAFSDWGGSFDETDEDEMDIDSVKKLIENEDSDLLSIFLERQKPELPLTTLFAKVNEVVSGREHSTTPAHAFLKPSKRMRTRQLYDDCSRRRISCRKKVSRSFRCRTGEATTTH